MLGVVYANGGSMKKPWSSRGNRAPCTGLCLVYAISPTTLLTAAFDEQQIIHEAQARKMDALYSRNPLCYCLPRRDSGQ